MNLLLKTISLEVLQRKIITAKKYIIKENEHALVKEAVEEEEVLS